MFTRMEPLITDIDLPEGIEASLEEHILKIKGPKGELAKEFAYPNVNLSVKDKKIIIKAERVTQKEKAITSTYTAHIKNMFQGVTKGFKYTLKVVFSHFPITLKTVENVVEIHNFFGEKAPRKAKILGNVEVKVSKDEIIVEGINKEEVSQTAANLEQATKTRRRDTRVFQDGIYIVDKTFAEVSENNE